MSERAREDRIDFVLRGMSLPDRLRLNATYRDASWNCIVDPFLLEYAADEIERLQQSPPLHREPIEADREAAEIAFNRVLGDAASFAEFGRPSYREGGVRTLADAFMRHRLAFSTPAASDAEAMREACAKVADDIAKGCASAFSVADQKWRSAAWAGAADHIAKAIRALPLPKAGEGEA